MRTKNTKKMFKSTADHDEAHFHSYAFMFFTTISTWKKVFFFRERAEKGIARHIDASSVVWTLVIFDWFALSMCVQVILDSLFARPGSAPIGDGKKGEFGNWTRSTLDVNWMQRVLKTMNNHWTMSKILWLVSGKQINYLPKLKAEANIVICETCPRLLLFSKGDNWTICWIK